MWNRIPPQYQTSMLNAARESEKKLKVDTRSLNVKAIELMKENDLVVHEVSDEDFKAWKEIVTSAYPYIRENIIPQRYFDEVMFLIQEYRDQHHSNSAEHFR